MQPFPRIRFVPDRERFLEELCRDGRILHLGCADAINIEHHAQVNRVLHLRLARVARALHGVDINERALGLLRERYGVGNLWRGDVQQLDLDFGTEFDVIVAGEVIEHLPNPGRFLQSLLRYMTSSTTLVLTTPNLFSLKLMVYGALGTERVHPDHVVGFTFSLMKLLLRRCGYEPSAWHTTFERFASTRNRMANAVLGNLMRVLPRYGDSIMVTCRKAAP